LFKLKPFLYTKVDIYPYEPRFRTKKSLDTENSDIYIKLSNN